MAKKQKSKETTVTTVMSTNTDSTKETASEEVNLEIPLEEPKEEIQLEPKLELPESEKHVYQLGLSERELRNSRVRNMVISLLDLRLSLKRLVPYYRLSSAEFELIKNSSSFVPKKKYKNNTKFKNEIGKYKGKRLVLE